MVRLSDTRTADRIEKSREHVSLELRPKTDVTGGSAYKWWGRSIKTDEQQCSSVVCVDRGLIR